jgi:hypothetical protein
MLYDRINNSDRFSSNNFKIYVKGLLLKKKQSGRTSINSFLFKKGITLSTRASLGGALYARK